MMLGTSGRSVPDMMADKSVLDVVILLPFVESDGRRGLRLMNAVEGELRSVVIFSTSARSGASIAVTACMFALCDRWYLFQAHFRGNYSRRWVFLSTSAFGGKRGNNNRWIDWHTFTLPKY
jgi:hypothetical protein